MRRHITLAFVITAARHQSAADECHNEAMWRRHNGCDG